MSQSESSPSYLDTGDRGHGALLARSEQPAPPASGGPAAELDPPPRLRDRSVLATLLLILALQLLTLDRLQGYMLADSVEYMDRAETVVRGEPLDPSTARSFAFSAVLVPFFAAAELLGLEIRGEVVFAVRLFQMLLGLYAVLVTMRLAARLVGRRAGIAAGFLLGTTPVFLQYTIAPLSGTAAMVCILLGTERLLERGGFRHGLKAGLWLGLGLLMAFQAIPILGALVGLAAVRDLRRHRPFLGGLVLGIAVLIAVQLGLDKLTYGSFGSSLWTYFCSNFVPIIGTGLLKLGLREQAIWIYNNWSIADADVVYQGSEGAQVASKTTRSWYFVHMHRGLWWSVLGCALLGFARLLRRPRWGLVILFAVVAVNVAAMSAKGSKSFRLWLPFLPMIAVFAGWGWQLVRGAAAHPPRWRTALAAALLISAPVAGYVTVRGTNLQKYAAFWQAMDRVNAAAARAADPADPADPPDPLRVASSYHWAVKYREGDGVELVKLPHHLDRWTHLAEDERQAVLDSVNSLDWFLSHRQALTVDPAMMAAVNARFEIADILYDREVFEELAPIYVLRRRGAAPPGAPARTFFEVFEDADPAAYQERIQHPGSVDYRRRLEDGESLQMVLLGWDVETGLADGTQAWITFHWWAGPLGGRDYTVMYRATDPREVSLGQVNQAPTYGVHPTSTWRQGSIVRESLLLPIPLDALRFGGPYCRGDLVPVRLWIAVGEFQEGANVGGLNPFHASGLGPIRKQPLAGGAFYSPDGRRFSRDGLMLVGGFHLPVPPGARIPDDGRPLPDPPRQPRP